MLLYDINKKIVFGFSSFGEFLNKIKIDFFKKTWFFTNNEEILNSFENLFKIEMSMNAGDISFILRKMKKIYEK